MKIQFILYVAILMVTGVVNLSIPVQGADQQQLSAAKQEQIRSIGKALLAAKRMVQEGEEMVAFKKDVQDAHVLVRKLIQPVDGRLQFENLKEAKGSLFKAEDEWTKARGDEIQQLRRVLTKLEERSHQLTAPMTTQSLQTLETKRSLSTLPATAGSKFAAMRKELETALQLAGDKRQEYLQRLADGLNLHSQSEMITEHPRTDSPGMLTSTSHRPLNAN